MDELAADLQAGRHRPSAIKRTSIPKPGSGQRPLGIPMVKDRIVQGALKCVLALIDAYLKADIRDGAEQWTPTGGTPQGAVISPLRWVRRKSRNALKDKIRAKARRNRGDGLAEIVADLNPMLRGW